MPLARALAAVLFFCDLYAVSCARVLGLPDEADIVSTKSVREMWQQRSQQQAAQQPLPIRPSARAAAAATATTRRVREGGPIESAPSVVASAPAAQRHEVEALLAARRVANAEKAVAEKAADEKTPTNEVADVIEKAAVHQEEKAEEKEVEEVTVDEAEAEEKEESSPKASSEPTAEEKDMVAVRVRRALQEAKQRTKAASIEEEVPEPKQKSIEDAVKAGQLAKQQRVAAEGKSRANMADSTQWQDPASKSETMLGWDAQTMANTYYDAQAFVTAPAVAYKVRGPRRSFGSV